MTGLTITKGVPNIWNIPCKEDPNFKGSVWELIEMSKWICPHCGSHLNKILICLNGCHLTGASLRKMNQQLTGR